MSSTPLMHIHPVLRQLSIARMDTVSLRLAVDTPWITGKRLDIFMSLTYFAIGILPLATLALIMVWPSVVLGIVLACLFPRYGKLALKGLIIGLIAVFLYDCMRIPFIMAGIWGDFIPKIGMWLLNT